MELYPTVFIDRDGTINIDAGYINHPDSFVMYPYAPQAVRMLNEAGFLAVVITNQSGLARGFFTIDIMNKVHDKMNRLLKLGGARIDGLYYCPHDPNARVEEFRAECGCRKPKTGMIEAALKDLPVDNSRMYFIGDKYSDMRTGFASGCKTIMTETGYGKGELLFKSSGWERRPDKTAANLLEAVRLILKKEV